MLEDRGISREQLMMIWLPPLSGQQNGSARALYFTRMRTVIKKDRKLDRIFTSRLTGFPIMLLGLLGIFWLTITGANYPSALLSRLLFGWRTGWPCSFRWRAFLQC